MIRRILMAKFSDRLRLLRMSKSLSQADFAKQIGISKSSVNMYERGEREPSFKLLETIADFFNISDPLRIIFTSNATESLNLAIKGLLRSGDHVVTTAMEHNSVLRPLQRLVDENIIWS